MATRGSQKKTNATKSMKELTKLEKEAEARSEKRKANVARNKAAGNAGLSSKRLNRMEAEYERKIDERRNAASKASRLGKAARVVGRFAGPVGMVAGGVEALNMLAPKDGVNKTERMKKDEKAVGTGSSGPTTRQSNRPEKPKTKATATKSAEKNYNVGKSQGGVSFNEAFRHFRNKGAKEFTWNGKRYNTKLKEEK